MQQWLRIGLVVWIQVQLASPELARLPMLFVHYQEHLAEDEELSFAGYLTKHYADDGHEESDHKDHSSLPFHHHHHGVVVDHCVTKVITSGPIAAVSFPMTVADREQPLPISGSLLHGHVGDLLRPPRMMA